MDLSNTKTCTLCWYPLHSDLYQTFSVVNTVTSFFCSCHHGHADQAAHQHCWLLACPFNRSVLCVELLAADNLYSLFTAKSALSLMLTHSVPHCTTCRSVTYQSLNLLVHTVHCHPQSLTYLCFAIAEHHHRLYIKVIGYVLSSSSNTHHHHQHVMCM